MCKKSKTPPPPLYGPGSTYQNPLRAAPLRAALPQDTVSITVSLRGDVGRNSRLLQPINATLARYCKKCEKVAALFQGRVSPVEVRLRDGDEALTNFSTQKIMIGCEMKGGVSEIADSILFELLNWQYGPLITACHDAMAAGQMSPLEVGRRIALNEAHVAVAHVDIMKDLQQAGEVVSEFACRNIQAVTDLGGPETFVSRFPWVPHNIHAPKSAAQSLPSARLYMYEAILNNTTTTHLATVAKAAPAGEKPAWYDIFVDLASKYMPQSDDACHLYNKFLCLAELVTGGVLNKGDYLFTGDMRYVAKSLEPVSGPMRQQVKSYVLPELKKLEGFTDKDLNHITLVGFADANPGIELPEPAVSGV